MKPNHPISYTSNSGKYKLGVALSGGGAKGFAHLGVLKALEDYGLTPDIICGTSAGALAGVLYADGYSPEEIVELFNGKELKEFAEIQMPVSGFFNSSGLMKFLERNLRAKSFEDLHIPLKVVTTDLDEGVSVIFNKGPLICPVVASCSIPIVFAPMTINNVNYVDGGLFKNFPVSVIREECTKIIGVNVSPLISKKYSKSMLHIAERSFHYLFRANTLLDRNLCDVLIEPEEIYYFKTFDLENTLEIFNKGYIAAQNALRRSIEDEIFSVLCITEDGQEKILLP